MRGKGNHSAITDIAPAHTIVAFPGNDSYPLANGIDAVGITMLSNRIAAFSK